MSSDTDASTGSSSSSSEYERKRKLQKKLKKKSKKHKKEKKSHKEKKRSRKDNVEENLVKIKPIAPPRVIDLNDQNEEAGSFGPALPPHLLNKNKTDVPIVIGPIIPKDIDLDLVEQEKSSQNFENYSGKSESDGEENLQGSYGPIPTASEQEMTATQIELEKRALELKLAAIDGSLSTSNVDQTVREEWMLELPDVGLKGGLAALNNLKRGFHQGKEKPDFRDRSSWTKTPQTAENVQPKPGTSKESKESLREQAEALYNKQRDDEQEAMAKKHKKKHKRDESLVDIHQKKLRKEERRKARELKESGAKPERRPFSRDIDLKMNKIDSHQTKQIVDKAKLLDSKFSRGHTKYL